MPSTDIQSAIEYCRVARRLRCRMENDPINKQRALGALAKHADRVRPAIRPEPVAAVDSGVRAFAEAVSGALEGPILRYSRRQQLIRQAQALGIRRFDANLLIAAVQHRLGNGNAGIPIQNDRKPSRWALVLPIGLAVALQLVIILGAWGVVHS